MRRAALFMLTAGFLLTAARSASAATMSVGYPVRFTPTPVPYLQADPGEANRVLVVSTTGGILVHDAGVAIRNDTGGLCRTVDMNTVRCSEISSVDLGDRDDTLDASRDLQTLSTEGGDGNDVLIASAKGYEMSGGAGADILRGGPGPDRLEGDEGDDRLYGGGSSDSLYGGAGRNLLDGGAGVDSANLSALLSPFDVDLRAGTARSAQSDDRLRSIESALGGGGNDPSTDRVAGDDGPNDLSGGLNDVLVGRGGDDVLHSYAVGPHGKPGTVTIDAGRGDDLVLPGSGADRLDCGPGDDIVQASTYQDRNLLIPRDCERLRFYGVRVEVTHGRVAAGRFLFEHRSRPI